MKRKNSGTPIVVALLVLVVALLACGNPAPEYMLRGWTVTPSLTEVVAQATQTPHIIQETVVVAQVISATPEPTGEPVVLCVVAQEAVHLRPSPSDQNYPILAMEHGQEVTDLGGRSGTWMFVQYGDKQGWVHSDFIGDCNE